jgi:glycyl-tRNA synthetase
VDTFADPMVDCLLTKKRFRADQIDPQSGMAYHYTGARDETAGKEVNEPYSVLMPLGKHADHARRVAGQFYAQRGLANPVLLGERSEPVENSLRYNPENGSLLTEPRQFNLMLKTFVGPVESEDNVAYLRPETAQAIFAQYPNVLACARQKVPFGICQIGKAFRNEINPRNFTFRSREFEQMELEFFIRPDEVVQKVAGKVAAYQEGQDLGKPQPDWGWDLWHRHWVEERLRWYESIGLGRDGLEMYWQKKEELAHYAKACVDIQYKFPFGTQELEGIAARGDFDLTQHQQHSGKSMEYFDEEAKAKYVPHVIEPSAGVDRLVLALICKAYSEDQVPDDKGKMETRVVMRFHPRVAPIKVGVFPLLKNKPDLVRKAREVCALLKPHMTVFYDEAGAIGRRYRRQDEAGTPFGITIDFDTLGEKPEWLDTVTLRDRDTTKQERVKISHLLPLLLEKIR